MRTIAITKICHKEEKEKICAAVEPDDNVLFFDSKEQLLSSEYLEQIDVLFGEPDVDTIRAMKGLRWVQMTWAGANKYTFAPDFPEHVKVACASGAFGMIISEYIVGAVLALYRNLLLYRTQMQQGGWERLYEETLEEKRVLIVGTGNIGQETARKLKCFGSHTVGIGRKKREELPFFDEYYTNDCLKEQLTKADLVILALPGTRETKGLFDREMLSLMRREAVLVNVGRGFIVDTQALTKMLQQGMLKGAVIDVVEPEPLPENHPLRTMEQVMLTPHVSGLGWWNNRITRNRILDILCENLKLDARKLPLNHVVNLVDGY